MKPASSSGSDGAGGDLADDGEGQLWDGAGRSGDAGADGARPLYVGHVPML
jgi:hypothetical protein